MADNSIASLSLIEPVHVSVVFFLKAQRSFSSAIAIDIEGTQEDLALEIIYRPGFGLPVAGYVARDPALHCSERTTVSLSPASQIHNSRRGCHRMLEWDL